MMLKKVLELESFASLACCARLARHAMPDLDWNFDRIIRDLINNYDVIAVTPHCVR